MGKTKAHGRKICWVEAVQEGRELVTNTTEQVLGGFSRDNLDPKFLRNGAAYAKFKQLHQCSVETEPTKLRFDNNQRLLALAFVDNLVLEELLQTLGNLSLLHRGNVLDSHCGRSKSVNSLKL